DDLLDISRVTSGKIVLSRRPLDLADAVRRCLATLRDTDRLSQHTWHESLEPVWVHADEPRVEQIVTNLVAHAAKLTPSGCLISRRRRCVRTSRQRRRPWSPDASSWSRTMRMAERCYERCWSFGAIRSTRPRKVSPRSIGPLNYGRTQRSSTSACRGSTD